MGLDCVLDARLIILITTKRVRLVVIKSISVIVGDKIAIAWETVEQQLLNTPIWTAYLPT